MLRSSLLSRFICSSGLVLASACINPEFPDFCLDFEGNCSRTGGTGGVSRTSFIVGLDLNKLDPSGTLPDGGYRAMLQAGDSVTLFLVFDMIGNITPMSDTVRSVLWSTSDSASAALTPLPSGGARLTAIKVGRVGTISANGFTSMWACGRFGPGIGCSRVGAIDIIPAPVP